MPAPLVIVLHIPGYRSIGLGEVLELVAAITFVLEYGMEHLDVSVEIGYLNGYALVDYTQSFTCYLDCIRKIDFRIHN